MNIAYILISTPNDTFYDQTAVSIMKQISPCENRQNPSHPHVLRNRFKGHSAEIGGVPLAGR